MIAEGWRMIYHRWHYFRAGASLCGKFGVQIIGGGEPRRPWPRALDAEQRAQMNGVCAECEAVKEAS